MTKIWSYTYLLGLCILCTTESAIADSKGEYPGKGDYAKWLQAADACEDGAVYAKNGNYTMALQCYDEAIQVFPLDAAFHFNRAIALKKKERLKEALEGFKKALELEPDYVSAWYNYANTLEEVKDFASAERAYRQALKYDPKHMKAWFNLGECLFAEKKFADAKVAFQNALELNCTEQDKKDIGGYLNDIDRQLKKLKSN